MGQRDSTETSSPRSAFVRDVVVFVSRAEDLPGEWIAHCLTLDIVAQGDSIRNAIRAVAESVMFAIKWDLDENLDPFEVRDRAPVEYWKKLGEYQQRPGVPLDAIADESCIEAAMAHFRIAIGKPVEDEDDRPSLPPAWQIAYPLSDRPSAHC